MTQVLTPQKAAELLKELQYAKAAMGGHLSIRDEYFKQALEQLRELNDKKEWIEWKGGSTCPIPHHAKAEIKFRDGDCAELYTWLDILEWRHKGYGSDIVAYRIIPEVPL